MSNLKLILIPVPLKVNMLKVKKFFLSFIAFWSKYLFPKRPEVCSVTNVPTIQNKLLLTILEESLHCRWLHNDDWVLARAYSLQKLKPSRFSEPGFSTLKRDVVSYNFSYSRAQSRGRGQLLWKLDISWGFSHMIHYIYLNWHPIRIPKELIRHTRKVPMVKSFQSCA